jgi:hypothetical protein
VGVSRSICHAGTTNYGDKEVNTLPEPSPQVQHLSNVQPASQQPSFGSASSPPASNPAQAPSGIWYPQKKLVTPQLARAVTVPDDPGIVTQNLARKGYDVERYSQIMEGFRSYVVETIPPEPLFRHEQDIVETREKRSEFPHNVTEFLQPKVGRHGRMLAQEVLDDLTEERTPQRYLPSVWEETPQRVEAETPQLSDESEQRQRPPKKGDIYQRRTRYDNEFLLMNADSLSQQAYASVLNPVDPLHEAAKQGLHVYAQAMAETEGAPLVQAASEHNIPNANFSRWARRGLFPILYKDSHASYVSHEIAQKVAEIHRQAQAEGKSTPRRLREMHDELFTAPIVSQKGGAQDRPSKTEGLVYERGRTRDKTPQAQGAEKPYEVVTTLKHAAEKTGVPYDEVLTTRDIEAEYHINKKLVHEYTRRGREGRPHLTPLSVRLSGGGGGQLLFRRGDIEKIVANPPKPGGSRKRSDLQTRA